MTDVDQFECQAKYVRGYLTTEQRVSDWVRGQSRKPHRITTKSLLPARTGSSDGSSTEDAEFAISTTIAHQKQTRLLDSESQIISPTVALISSALLVCVILPSLLTVSVFVVLLTYASSLEVPVTVRLAILAFTVLQSFLHTYYRTHKMKAPLSIMSPPVNLLCNSPFISNFE